MMRFAMGVQPRPPDYQVNDHFCWPAGQTPTTLKVFFAGIERGATWNPGDPNPPNGYYDMIRTGPVSQRWMSGVVHPRVYVDFTPAATTMLLTASTGVQAFFHQAIGQTCVKYMDNEAGPFGTKFRFGDAWITGYDFPWDIAELVMNAYWNDPNYECFPMPSEQLAIRVARIQDGTNIIIKFDHDLA